MEFREGERDAHNKVDALICFSIWMHPTDQLLDQRAEHVVTHTRYKHKLQLAFSPCFSQSHNSVLFPRLSFFKLNGQYYTSLFIFPFSFPHSSSFHVVLSSSMLSAKPNTAVSGSRSSALHAALTLLSYSCKQARKKVCTYTYKHKFLLFTHFLYVPHTHTHNINFQVCAYTQMCPKAHAKTNTQIQCVREWKCEMK